VQHRPSCLPETIFHCCAPCRVSPNRSRVCPLRSPCPRLRGPSRPAKRCPPLHNCARRVRWSTVQLLAARCPPRFTHLLRRPAVRLFPDLPLPPGSQPSCRSNFHPRRSIPGQGPWKHVAKRCQLNSTRRGPAISQSLCPSRARRRHLRSTSICPALPNQFHGSLSAPNSACFRSRPRLTAHYRRCRASAPPYRSRSKSNLLSSERWVWRPWPPCRIRNRPPHRWLRRGTMRRTPMWAVTRPRWAPVTRRSNAPAEASSRPPD